MSAAQSAEDTAERDSTTPVLKDIHGTHGASHGLHHGELEKSVDTKKEQ
jgi:hypothetical protein